MKSRITGGETKLLFRANVLCKYDVAYYQCCETGFIQTEEPYWLNEAYSSAITKPDVGLIDRNINFSEILPHFLAKHFDHEAKFLDFAGGYGMFSRLMRDKGFDFYTTDKYCENLFAEYYDLSELKEGQTFEAVTAFEVFEHLRDPLSEIPEILQYSSNMIFSTEILRTEIKKESDWWYICPETGQHISFYTIKSLEFLAAKFGKRFYSNGKNLHLFTDQKFSGNPMACLRDPFLIRKIKKYLKKYDKSRSGNKKGLMEQDWNEAKGRITLNASLNNTRTSD